MTKIRVAIVGLGNIGRYAVEAVRLSTDMELAGIVRRKGSGAWDGVPVVDAIEKLGAVDVALLCVPTRSVQEMALPLLASGISTVDSFDVHGMIGDLHRTLGEAAAKAGSVAVISAGWDPGSDSVIRALFTAMAPQGTSDTDFGPGMSMGHSVAARGIAGVADALSVTLPKGSSMHRRMVYVQLEAGADFEDVRARLLADPYFSSDETHVIEVDDVAALRDMGHGVKLTRKGVSSGSHNQMLAFEMRINNPALTAQIMVGCARAATRQRPGAYAMIEIPPVDLLPGERMDWVRRLV